jgi:hypothetical protein
MLALSCESADMNNDVANLLAILIPIVVVLLIIAFVLSRNRNRRTKRKAGEPWMRIIRDKPDGDPNKRPR